jgi:hypothetical protein
MSAAVVVAATAVAAASAGYSNHKARPHLTVANPVWAKCSYCGRSPDINQAESQCKSCGASLGNENVRLSNEYYERMSHQWEIDKSDYPDTMGDTHETDQVNPDRPKLGGPEPSNH